MPHYDLHAEFEKIREELICRESYGRMTQLLDGKMAAVAIVLDAPWLGKVAPGIEAIEEILIRVIEWTDAVP